MALIDIIKIDKNAQVASPKAGELIAFRDTLARLLAQGPGILATMNHAFDDSNPQAINWVPLETTFGIPEGQGQTVFDMVNGVMGAVTGTMQNAQAGQLVARIV